MSVRGTRRGRGRGKTMIVRLLRSIHDLSIGSNTQQWEWETYTPPPSVYDNIWHIRQAPVTVTPTVPNDCPIPDARTRILERRQTEDGFGRNFYYVEITYLGDQESANAWVQSSDTGGC
jgi:hypothetical protein